MYRRSLARKSPLPNRCPFLPNIPFAPFYKHLCLLSAAHFAATVEAIPLERTAPLWA